MAPNQAAGLFPVPELEGFRLPGTDTAGRLMDEVASITRDPSFGATDILGLLNRGLLEIAGRIRLPHLETAVRTRTVPGRPWLALPADYHRDLLSVTHPEQRRRVRLLSGIGELERRFPGLGLTGNVSAAAVSAGNLYYQGVPAAPATLQLRYYRAPEPLEAETDRAHCLPPHLAAALLVSYACREIFERIEEGADGAKVQTARFADRFEQALRDLCAFVGPQADEPQGVADAMGYLRSPEEWECV